jgi:hypothetical protein
MRAWWCSCCPSPLLQVLVHCCWMLTWLLEWLLEKG